MAYRCDQAIIGRAEELIRCKVSGGACAHQRMCMMEGRIVLTDGAMECPARNGKPAEDPKPEAVKAETPKAEPEQKPAKKPATRSRKK